MEAQIDISTLANRGPTFTFMLDKPQAKALNLLRDALKAEGLRIAMQVDAAGRVGSELGVELKPCFILGVDSTALLLQSMVVDTSTAGILPLHVVISQVESHSLIHLVTPGRGLVPAGLSRQFGRFIASIQRAIRQTGARELRP